MRDRTKFLATLGLAFALFCTGVNLVARAQFFNPPINLIAGCRGICKIGSNANNTGTTVALTGVNVPSGALIIVAALDSGGAGGSLSDGGTNTYTADDQATAQIGNWVFFYKVGAAALSGATLTYTKAASSDGAIAAFYATGFAGGNDATVTTKSNGATGTTTSPTITSGAPTVTGELMVAIDWTVVTGGLSFTQDTGNGWASIVGVPFVQATAGNNNGIALGYQINAGTSAKTFNPTWSAATRWALSTYGFKP